MLQYSFYNEHEPSFILHTVHYGQIFGSSVNLGHIAYNHTKCVAFWACFVILRPCFAPLVWAGWALFRRAAREPVSARAQQAPARREQRRGGASEAKTPHAEEPGLRSVLPVQAVAAPACTWVWETHPHAAGTHTHNQTHMHTHKHKHMHTNLGLVFTKPALAPCLHFPLRMLNAVTDRMALERKARSR